VYSSTATDDEWMWKVRTKSDEARGVRVWGTVGTLPELNVCEMKDVDTLLSLCTPQLFFARVVTKAIAVADSDARAHFIRAKALL